jgi:hypothetical protein
VSCSVSVRGCGSLLLYATSAPSACTVSGIPVSAEFAAEQCAVRVPVPRSGDSLLSTVQLHFAL